MFLFFYLEKSSSCCKKWLIKAKLWTKTMILSKVNVCTAEELSENSSWVHHSGKFIRTGPTKVRTIISWEFLCLPTDLSLALF